MSMPPEARPAFTGESRIGPPPGAGQEVDPDEAEQFVELFHVENPQAGDVTRRARWVRAEIATTGTYRHTTAELTFGARVAWRNSARCIGRLYWKSLHVRDLRAVYRGEDVAGHCVDHLRIATNEGRIRPMISVFPPDEPNRPGPRIWNEQLIRYAGYAGPDGDVVGDPRYRGFTDAVIAMGWRRPKRIGRFDVLPLVIETAEDGPVLYPLPPDAVLEVPLTHPDFPWFAGLRLRWHAVPVISNMRLVIGGVSYPAAPFNGWYMGTEIGARNLADPDRYAMVRAVAERLGLDTSTESSLWRDRALVELNRAVLHSYAAANVTITDHHTESQRFMAHLAKEEAQGRRCPADWSWIVPPMSGPQTPVFHRYYDEDRLRPEFVTDDDATRRALHGSPRCFTGAASRPAGSDGGMFSWLLQPATA